MAIPGSKVDDKPSSSHSLDPSAPQTPPQRQGSFPYSSPSISYTSEPESVILELGCRHLTAGLAGEEFPRCRLGFGPESSRRVGDYRPYLPGYAERARKRRRLSSWGDESELYDLELQKCNLHLVQDKLERAVREAYTKYLLLEAKTKKVCLIVPSVLPHRLLDRMLVTLFEGFSVPGVTLMAPPALAIMGSGLRGGLVVDIGWKETVVTALYEYREVGQSRSIRAMKMVSKEMASIVDQHDAFPAKEKAEAETKGEDLPSDKYTYANLDEIEDITARMAWCNPRVDGNNSTPSPPTGAPANTATDTSTHSSPPMEIPSIRNPSKSILIPFDSFRHPIERTLLSPSLNRHDHDDHDQPLPTLIFKSLTRLPPDIRAYCMARIIFVGGGSHVLGLKSRLLNELTALVERRGFDTVEGKVADHRREKLREISGNVTPRPTATVLSPVGQPPPVLDEGEG